MKLSPEIIRAIKDKSNRNAIKVSLALTAIKVIIDNRDIIENDMGEEGAIENMIWLNYIKYHADQLKKIALQMQKTSCKEQRIAALELLQDLRTDVLERFPISLREMFDCYACAAQEPLCNYHVLAFKKVSEERRKVISRYGVRRIETIIGELFSEEILSALEQMPDLLFPTYHLN